MVIEVKQDGKFVKIPFISTNYPVGEAPEDGKQYARKDGDWSEVVIPDVDLTEIETNIAANTAAIDTKVDKVDGKQLSTEDYTTADKTKVANLPTPDSIVVTTDPRLTVATTTKDGLMSAADKVQLDSTLTATEIENKVNAAVSSVYRVKGTVATVANLPTTGVAVGDVWNIADNGANYVATNSNPVEWDKLSETVDLAPYMQTSTANSTFVKKTGDTMTGDLIIGSSKAATIDGTDKINVRNPLVSNQHCSLNNNGLDIFSPATSANGGISYLDSTGNSFIGFIGARVTGDTLNRLFLGWGKDPANMANQFYVNENDIKYKNINVALTDSSSAITVHNTPGSNARTYLAGNGLTITPTATNNATGLIWRNQNNTATLLQLGAFTNGDSETNYCFMGWGASPWNAANNLSVGADRLTYKNERIWYAGNDGAGSGLDADTVDGHQVGFRPNEISTNINFPNYTDLINLGLLESSYPTQGYPVHSYLKALCKWAISTYTNLGDINLCGTAIPSSSGYCVLHLYSSNGSDSASGLPKYCSGSYVGTETIARIIKFGTADGVWYSSDIANPTVVLTQDEYNALGSTVNSDGKIYFIKE